MKSHIEVIHPRDLLKKPTKGIAKFNTAIALKITKGVGSMWCAYAFFILDLLMIKPVINAHSITLWVTYIAQTVLQLVLLPIIMVGQNVIQSQNDAKADADHHTLTYLATLQDEQMSELKGIAAILETIKKENKSK